MQHSILLSEETQAQQKIEVSKKADRNKFPYPKWINEHTLLSVSIVSFCTLLVLLGSPLWLAIGLTLLFLGIQLWVYLKSGDRFDIELNPQEIQQAITKDLFNKE